MKLFSTIVVIIAFFLFVAISFAVLLNAGDELIHPKPSDLLRFQPVCEGSDPNLVRIAQAELCRHGVYGGRIDGICKKKTALAQCKLWVMSQNGYEVRTIYEKR